MVLLRLCKVESLVFLIRSFAKPLNVIANCKTTPQTNRQIELDRQNKTVDN